VSCYKMMAREGKRINQGGEKRKRTAKGVGISE
jgi:hypothetical protein